MKLKIFSLTLLVLFCLAVPVLAEDLTDASPAGSSEVSGNVSSTEPGGNVTYTISIPATISFGSLTQPGDNKTPHINSQSFTVALTEVSNLTQGQIAVLMKDATNADFTLTGQGTANKDKTLTYQVLDASGADIQKGSLYPNGYLLATLKTAGSSVNGSLSLDQNQLYMQNLKEWSGPFKGTINFFSKVVTVNDVN